jgi:Putative MetA-pathway of phenol degradation
MQRNTCRIAIAVLRRLAWSLIAFAGVSAHAQTLGTRAPAAGAESADTVQPPAPTPEAGDTQPAPSETGLNRTELGLVDRLWAVLLEDEDPDGPINTDRPTFTPANTVVPRGRLQLESGFTFNYERTSATRAELYDFPELAIRYGLTKRLEFRTFWLGETFAGGQPTVRSRGRINGGLGNMEIGFKWQLFTSDEDRKWLPTTALITSIFAPTGGNSPFSSSTVEPYFNLIYGWGLSNKLTLAGSTGYLGLTQTASAGPHPIGEQFQRYHQSVVAFYTITERSTLFYEWYILMFTNAADNRPTHFMDAGILYRPTPNTQLDLRAGAGLSGRPEDFFTGVGFSVRF